MSNVDQFKQSFREEAREILVDLEAALLELNERPADMDLVGRIFRALHTIKGSGAMFGFENLAAFTHNLESAYDEVRNGRLAVSGELVDLTLSALDQIRAMVEEGSGQAGGDVALCQSILGRVQVMTGKRSKAMPEAAQAEKSSCVLEPLHEWHVSFHPGPGMMANGANPLLLLRELGALGGMALKASLDGLPPFAELDPERCYVSWELVLTSSATLEAIRDVFIFVEDQCELAIESARELPAAAAGAATSAESAQIVAVAEKPSLLPLTDADRTAQALEEKRGQQGGRRVYDKPDMATSLRVPAAKLDQFVDLVGELVTVQARLSEIAARSEDAEISAVAEEIERLTGSLRENSMNIRMMPIRGTFEKFRRLVHDLARELGKDVELTIEGAETELDKTVIDQLSDPLMHLIRNSMDHGIEAAEVRAAHGKGATASIHLSARYAGASVMIGVADDGGGINAEAVRARAIEKGVIAAEAQLSEQQCFALIFEPGFSTAKQVTDISGRGVGMDVVRQRVEALRGSIEVESKPGEGTRVTLRLPLTLAIIDGLLVSVGEAFFVLPLANTLECIELSSRDIAAANGKHVVNVRDEIVPYIRLREHFHIQSPRPEIEQVMIVETEEGRYGFVVDQVLGDCQTVIKSLGRFYRHVQTLSGATILGNGKVALILDPYRLVQEALRIHAAGGARARPSAVMRESARATAVA